MNGYLEEYFPLAVFFGLSLAFGLILMLAPPRREGSIRIQAYSIPQFIEEALVENT